MTKDDGFSAKCKRLIEQMWPLVKDQDPIAIILSCNSVIAATILGGAVVTGQSAGGLLYAAQKDLARTLRKYKASPEWAEIVAKLEPKEGHIHGTSEED